MPRLIMRRGPKPVRMTVATSDTTNRKKFIPPIVYSSPREPVAAQCQTRPAAMSDHGRDDAAGQHVADEHVHVEPHPRPSRSPPSAGCLACAPPHGRCRVPSPDRVLLDESRRGSFPGS